jgi:N-acetylneuraminic acid mutarotase
MYIYFVLSIHQLIYFTPETTEWFIVSAVMPRPRYRHMSVAVDRHLYVFGGRELNDSLITQVDRFDVQSGLWEADVFSWPAASSDGSAFAVADMVYLVGGYDAEYDTLTRVETLNVTSGKWGFAANLTVGRGDIALAEWNGERPCLSCTSVLSSFSLLMLSLS